MGVRTKHYEHRHRPHEVSQIQNEPEDAINVHTAEVEVTPPSAPPKSRGGKSRRKAKPKTATKKVTKTASNTVAKSPPLVVTAAKPSVIPIPEKPLTAVTLKVAAKSPATSKKPAKKRKQKGKGKILSEPPPVTEKVVVTTETRVDKQPSSRISKAAETQELKKDNKNLENTPLLATENTVKNGILKTNNRLKKGMRNLMERTNKILERSRNCKKQPRKKSPVKPRILPARASARLCVRKNSGEHEQGLTRSDKPLRTVELIKRPLELREPATKLLYLASLSLYPTADPESDTTPIVIISEEIPNLNGKKPRMRSLELPLLPNWKIANFHPPSRASVVDDPVLLSINSIASPGPGITCQDSGNEKPSRKRKAVGKKPKAETENCITEDFALKEKKQNDGNDSKSKASKIVSSEDDSQLIQDMQAPANCSEAKSIITEILNATTKPEQPKSKLEKKKPPARKKSSKKIIPSTCVSLQLSNSSISEISNPVVPAIDLSSTILKFPLDSGLTISTTAPPVKSLMMIPSKVNVSSSNQFIHSNIFSIAVVESTAQIPPLAAMTPLVVNTDSGAAINQQVSVKSAPVKRKRKSLETIIKEIPKTKSLRANVEPASAQNVTGSVQSTSPSSNPILEGLMKNPVKKRPSKAKMGVTTEQSQHPSMAVTVMNMQNPVSMTVPLQPAPANSNIVPMFNKDNSNETVKQRNKKQKPKFQLPMPLPIPLPPGLLNYASLLPSNNFSEPPKPRKQRKTKAPKAPAAILGVPCLPQRQSHLPPHGSSNQLASIPYLPSHLEAFYHSTPIGNGGKELVYDDPDQALDLCVKAVPIALPKKIKKAKPPIVMKSLLKPLNIEEDGPLNLVISRGISHVPVVGKKPETIDTTLPLTETLKQQGNLENVKQMLARLHTKIAPAVNGVQLITIE